MNLLRLAVVPLFFVAPPAFAQQDSIALIARLMAGLSDGGETLMGSFGTGKVEALEGGAFEVSFEDGKSVTFLYDQPDTCRFTQHVQMMGQPPAESRLDFTLVTGVEVRDQGAWEGLPAALITFEGPPETLQVLLDDKYVNQEPAFAFLASSVPVAEMQAAADELLRIC